jgi:parallel beta-helix repeat protein
MIHILIILLLLSNGLASAKEIFVGPQEIENANNCELKNNVFYSDQSVEAHGIYLFQSLSTVISNCTFRHLNQGIYLDSTHNNSLSENVFSFCDSGLFLSESNQNLIYGNTYVSNSIAVNIYISNRNTVVGNLVHNNETGIQLYASRDVIVSKMKVFFIKHLLL